MRNFLSELKRRNVLRAGAVFLVAGWVTLQVVDILGESLGLPSWTVVAVAISISIGLPVVMLFSWFFEVTPDGIVPTKSVPSDASITLQTGRKIDRLIIVLLSVALIFFVWDFVTRSGNDDSVPLTAPKMTLAIFPFPEGLSDQFDSMRQITRELEAMLVEKAGMAITPASVVENLKVKEPLREAGRVLQTGYLLLFSEDERSNLQVHLYDVANDTRVWNAIYDESENALDFQQRIAKQIAVELGAVNSLDADSLFTPPTINAEAFRLYLAGMRERTRSRFAASREDSVARDYFQRALDVDPRFAAPHAALCELELNLYAENLNPTTFESAERHCFRGLTLGRESAEIHISLGQLYLRSGQFDRAEASFTEALSINPSYIGALLGLARVQASKGEMQRAEQIYLQAASAQPTYYAIYDAMADFYYGQSDPELARENLLLAAELAPENPRILNDLGTTYLFNGLLEDAEQQFQRSLALEPNEAFAMSNLATVYYYRGQYSDALPIYEQARDLNPHDPSTWRNLGDLFRAMGDDERANGSFRKALELGESAYKLNPRDPFLTGNLLVATAALGDEVRFSQFSETLQSLELTHPGALYDLAIGYCRMGRIEECRRAIVDASDNGFPVVFLRLEPDLERAISVLNPD